MEDSSLKFENHFPSNTAILIGVLFVIALIGTWYFYTQKMSPVQQTPAPTPVEDVKLMTPTDTPIPVVEVSPSPVPLVDTRITGLISLNDPGCYADGICSISVGNSKIILATGGDRMMQEQTEKGLLLKKDGKTVAAISDFAVGKKVQIFANQLDGSTLTIYGKSDYFVKLLN